MLAAILYSTNMAIDYDQPTADREFRAVWVATVDNIDWPSKKGLTTPQMKAELLTILDKTAALNMNAIIFQVRPACDALYRSSLEPWSYYLTGIPGKAPDDGFDPLAFAVKEGHKRGLEVHAWFNPYRAQHPSQKASPSSGHVSNTNPDVVKKYGNMLWMDPGEPFVQDRSYHVFLDVVKRYDVDGVHIDDYFYPYPLKKSSTTVPFPDDSSWTKYRASGGKLGRDDWRRQNVDKFIQRVYLGIKAAKPWVKFGISPFGIYRPGVPEGIRAGVDQYAELYADAKKWLVEGWCDYFTPQLYWPIAQEAQSYPKLLKWWANNNPKGRHIWPGSFSSRLNPNDGNWHASELVNQIRVCRDTIGATGQVHFSVKAFTKNWAGIDEALLSGPYKHKALVPPSPWLGSAPPSVPHVRFDWKQSRAAVTSRDRNLRYWASFARNGGQWNLVEVVPATESSVPIPVSGSTIAIAAVDKAGNVGRAVVEVRPS